MKQFKLINLIACALLMTCVSACSDNDKDDPVATGTSAKVTVTCVADKNNDSPIEVVLTDSHTGDATLVEPGQTFTKEFEVSELPNTAGFVIFPSVTDENGKCSYTVKGEVALMDGKRVVKKEEIDEKVTVTDIETDHTKAFMFNVTSEGMQRVTDFTDMEIPDDKENDIPSGGKEIDNKPENFITNKISKAYKVTFNVIHKIDKKDFRDSKKVPDGGYDKYKGNEYSVENYIYPIYDIKNDINYYYIEQHITASFFPSYCGIFNKTFPSDGCWTIGKVCEWYGESVRLTTTPKNFDMETYETMPKTDEGSKTFTNSITLGFSGEVSAGVKGEDPEVLAKVGANYSSTRTITYVIGDVSVEAQKLVGNQIGWIFNINNWPEVKYAKFNTALTSITSGAKVGRSTLEKTTIFYFKVKNENLKDFPVLNLDLDVVLGSTGAKCDRERGSREMFVSESAEIKLPYAKKDASTKNGFVFEFPSDTIPARNVQKSKKNNLAPGYYKIENRKKQWSDL